MSDAYPAVRWRVGRYLERRGLTPAALVRASGLGSATVHALVAGRAEAVRLETLSALIGGLERLTGEFVEPGDLLALADPWESPDRPRGWKPGEPGDAGP